MPTAPALARDALHTKMEQLEEQLLSKILTLQKERQAANSDRSQQQHDIEKELNSLQSRVAELEHGESCPTGNQAAWGDANPKVHLQGSPGMGVPTPRAAPDPPFLSSPSLTFRISRLQPSRRLQGDHPGAEQLHVRPHEEEPAGALRLHHLHVAEVQGPGGARHPFLLLRPQPSQRDRAAGVGHQPPGAAHQ